MPLVRIALMKGPHQGYGRKIGEIVYRALVDVIQVPHKDHFQIISEHDADSLIYDPDYLGIRRSDGVVFVQITLDEGPTVEMKKALYAEIAERLHDELAMRREDVLINLVEVKKENWSFGNGIAQYA